MHPPMTLVQTITSKDNPLVQKLRKLASDPVAYRKLGDLWIEGDHLCAACVQRGQAVPVAVIADSAWSGAGGSGVAADPVVRRLTELAQAAQKVVVVPEAMFKQFTALESPARIGFVLNTPQDVGVKSGVRTVILDRLQDAGNVGTILRSASALGVQQVVAIKGTAALWSPKVLRAAMGAHWALNLVEQASVDDLSALGVPLVATSSHADHELPVAPLPDPCAWVLGHEGQGVAQSLMALCDMTVAIPQPGGEESLNVAVAASICLYESARRRQ